MAKDLITSISVTRADPESGLRVVLWTERGVQCVFWISEERALALAAIVRTVTGP